MRGIPNDSFLPLDRNVAINVELCLYGNAARTQGEVKINATASVHALTRHHTTCACIASTLRAAMSEVQTHFECENNVYYDQTTDI